MTAPDVLADLLSHTEDSLPAGATRVFYARLVERLVAIVDARGDPGLDADVVEAIVGAAAYARGACRRGAL